ncbi:hypothetical protein HK104_006298 [Borealophlyctis nickersoniae]|nr:hypothetical protein HK104_006298 [Borealophlyctis nickersoniae]
MSKVEETLHKAEHIIEDNYSPIQHSAGDLLTKDPQTLETTDTPLRFLGYLARIRNLATAGSRYLAYTSDVGEAFRPVVPPWIVKSAYGISFAYVGIDVAFEAYKAQKRGDPTPLIARTVIERSTFQGLASLALPAITIHTVVDTTAKLLKNRPKTTFVRWAPTTAGLLVVPLLPVLFDHPVEGAVEKAFDIIWPVDKKHAHTHEHTHTAEGKKDL